MGTRSRRRYWTALATEFGSEQLAQKSLRSVGVECENFLYRGRRIAVRGEGFRPVLPLFEGYLLWRWTPRTDLNVVRYSKGVRQLLHGVVPDEEIRFIRDRVGLDGYVVVEDQEPPAFSLKDLVTATTGAFAGHSGEYRGIDENNQKRASVAFSLMGCEVLSSILRYDLAPAH